MAIGYEIDRITTEDVEDLERRQAEAPPNAKYAAFRARLFYGNLNRWQSQGYHFNYMTFVEQIHCTCGLYWVEDSNTNSERISPEVTSKLQSLKIDQIQTVKGHLSLDDFLTPTIALLVDFLWEPKIGDYLWTALCQECGSILTLVPNSVARHFVSQHNMSCYKICNEK